MAYNLDDVMNQANAARTDVITLASNTRAAFANLKSSTGTITANESATVPGTFTLDQSGSAGAVKAVESSTVPGTYIL